MAKSVFEFRHGHEQQGRRRIPARREGPDSDNFSPAGRLAVLAWPAFVNRVRNPYNYLLYSYLRTFGVRVDEVPVASLWGDGYDVWHVHWPEWPLNMVSASVARAGANTLLSLIDRARGKGTRLIWTVHNLRSHEQLHPVLERAFWDRFVPRVDGFISLSESGLNLAQERFPLLKSRPGFVIPHGHYRDVYPNRVDKRQARQQLGLPAGVPVIAFVGRVRPYKNVPQLVRAFSAMSQTDAVLLIAGSVGPRHLRRELQQAAKSVPGMRLFPRFVSGRDMQLYVNAADLVVLPYQEIFNSGSALLALSFDRPVLVPEMGALGELRDQVGEAWVRTYCGDLTMETLVSALAWALERPAGIHAPLAGLEWPVLARRTLEAYRAVCGERQVAA